MNITKDEIYRTLLEHGYYADDAGGPVGWILTSRVRKHYAWVSYERDRQGNGCWMVSTWGSHWPVDELDAFEKEFKEASDCVKDLYIESVEVKK